MDASLPPAWDPDRDEELVCVAVRPETHDISSFVFAPAQPSLFRFLPGQFMTFELGGPGSSMSVQRCYTIASPPTRPWRIEIAAKRTAGIGSAWLHATMRPGVRVRAQGPMGEFTFGPNPAGKYLFLSAGSGITPLMSMSRTLHDLGSDADVLFLHSARSPADLPFADELAAMGRRPGFRPVSIVEQDAPGARWDGFRGRLSSAVLGMVAPDLLIREVFCCGPAPYMAAARSMLDEAGFDRARYHEESFDFGAEESAIGAAAGAPIPAPSALSRAPKPVPTPVLDVPAPAHAPAGFASVAVLDAPTPTRADVSPHVVPAVPAVAAVSGTGQAMADAHTFTVRFARSGQSIACPSGTTVLAAARAAGVRLPSACAKGVCGTCKSHLVSGTVEMRHGGGIRQREIDAGMALLCCSKPTSDLLVDR